MEPTAKLIYHTSMSYLQTSQPVNFYGLPDGKVYLVYSRFYKINFERSGLEFVFATHEEFLFDYNSGKLYLLAGSEKLHPVYPEMVDKPDPKIRIIKVYRSFYSYGEAQQHLNLLADEMDEKNSLIVVN